MHHDDQLKLGQERHALLAPGCLNSEPWVRRRVQFYTVAFRGLISAVLLWLFNMLCGQAKISELFPPHSAFAVSGLVLLKFFFWAFHHRGPESDSWGESVKAYSVLHFSSRTSRFVPRQNVGLRTCPSSPTRCHRVFCVWLHHLVAAPRSDTGNNYPPVVVMTPAGM